MRSGAVAAAALLLAIGVSFDTSSALVGPGLVLVNAEITRTSPGENATTVFTIHTRRGQRIGWGIRVCHRVGVGGVLGKQGTDSCMDTYSLPRGRIMTQGARRTEFAYYAAVTGGTGLYSNVGGTLYVQRTGSRRERLFFSLEGLS